MAEALARYAGPRFVDARQQRRDQFSAPDFMVVLRGYDMDRVDALIRCAQDAMSADSVIARYGAKAGIVDERRKLPIAARGYDRDQVDAFLDALATELATIRGMGDEPPGP